MVCSLCKKYIKVATNTIKTNNDIVTEFNLCDECSNKVIDYIVKLKGFDNLKDYAEHVFEIGWDFSHFGEN